MVVTALRLFREGLHMFFRHLRVQGVRFTRLGEDASEICKSISEKLWTGEYYKTSLGNYPHFYCRDFGIVVPSLLTMGHKQRVMKTLDYALAVFQKYGGIRTFINRWNYPVNFPNVYSPDSVAYMFRSVVLLNDKKLINKYRSFLQSELDRFYKEAIDEKTGLIKRHKHFGGMRDHSIRDSSCYDNTMAALVSKMADTLKLQNPLNKFNYKKLLIDNFWTGNYFKDDLSSDKISSDANVFPFWLGIITDSSLLKKSVASIHKYNLDEPLSIRYVANNHEEGKTIWLSFLSYGWQHEAIWPMAGLPHIENLFSVDKKKANYHLRKIKEKIEQYGTFLEVYDGDGKPYNSPFFSCDEGIIWSLLWLDLYTR